MVLKLQSIETKLTKSHFKFVKKFALYFQKSINYPEVVIKN